MMWRGVECNKKDLIKNLGESVAWPSPQGHRFIAQPPPSKYAGKWDIYTTNIRNEAQCTDDHTQKQKDGRE